MRERTVLEKWLEAQSASEFPTSRTGSYFDRYWQVARYLEGVVHPEVEKGALMRGDGYLTDHGVNHILTVQRRIQELIGQPEGLLEPYEMYLLLMAVQFHDVGNVYGREFHALRSSDVMKHVGKLMGDDEPEKRTIMQIVEAHTSDGQLEDTIGLLPRKEPVMNFEVRNQALAALLRLSDELAEDSARASRFAMDNGIVPKESVVYHQYALHLHSVKAYQDTRTIDLRFQMDAAQAMETFPKAGQSVYLLDEIYGRLLKLHYERAYCMRFLVPLIYYDTVKVTIRVFKSRDSPHLLDEVGFRLRETGYPNPSNDIRDVCSEVTVDGQALKEKVEAMVRDDE